MNKRQKKTLKQENLACERFRDNTRALFRLEYLFFFPNSNTLEAWWDWKESETAQIKEFQSSFFYTFQSRQFQTLSITETFQSLCFEAH